MEDKSKLRLPSPICHNAPLAKASPSDEIPTPKRTVQLPRRAARRSLSFSVNDVRKVAMGLRMTRSKSANRSDLLRTDQLERKSQPCSGSSPLSSAVRSKEKLPENYEMLAEFFNCLDSSIRLIRLKGMLPTFTSLSTSIQHLTNRRFTYKHLAQMKHIFPEAISFKKMLLRDEATCCMKPELQISLQVDAVESSRELKGESAYSALRKAFRSRLMHFAKEHPEEDDIPEEVLPHPFGHSKSKISSELHEGVHSITTGSTPASYKAEQLTTVSHLSSSFQRRFSKRIPCSDEMKTPLAFLNDAASKADSLASSFASPIKFLSKSPIDKKSLFSSAKRHLVISDNKFKEDSKLLNNDHNASSETMSFESTPVKSILTSPRSTTVTPELQTPKKSRKQAVIDAPKKELVKPATRTKLFATPRKNVKSDCEESLPETAPVEDDILGFLPESLLQDIKAKEKIAMEESDPNVVQARSRKKMIASLPKLFDSILLIFQSENRSVITKQELLHKILSSHFSIIDRNEVEEQLELMEELIPDWISRKATCIGDTIYRLNKVLSSHEVRQRLVVAE